MKLHPTVYNHHYKDKISRLSTRNFHLQSIRLQPTNQMIQIQFTNANSQQLFARKQTDPSFVRSTQTRPTNKNNIEKFQRQAQKKPIFNRSVKNSLISILTDSLISTFN